MAAREDLEALLGRGISWIADNRARFDPAIPPTHRGARADKPLVELAVMTRRLAEPSHGHHEVQAIGELLTEMLARPRYQEGCCRSRADVVAGAFLLAAVDRVSTASRALRQRLQRTVDAGVLDGLERPVHRVMEERLALDWAGIGYSLPSWERLAAESLLGAAPNAIFLGNAAAYQLTHDVLYLTGFGSRPPVCALGDPEDHRQRLVTLIVRFTIREHWDLVAELLLCWASMGLGPSGVCDAVWERLLNEAAPDGSIHAVSEEAGSEVGSEQWFHARYHTTLVAIMAAETWLQAGAGEQPSGQAGQAPRRAAPATELAREVADVEAEWLASLLGDGTDQHLRTQCSVLVGVWICSTLSPAAGERLPALTASVVAALDGDRAWTELPAALVFVTYGLLMQQQLAPAGLVRYVDAAADALARSRPDDLSLGEARWLLHRLGLVEAPVAVAAPTLLESAHQLVLEPTEANAERVVLAAESRASFGAASGCGPGWVSELLLGLAVHRARTDDLVSAGRATRAAVHLGGSCTGAAYELARYMTSRQRPEGGFGPTQQRRDAGNGSEDPLAGQLALSLSCLWTLAEVTTDWRLTTAL